LSECFFLQNNIQLCTLIQEHFMSHLRTSTSLLRRAILIGWAVAVVWIYLGNLVNFHQNRIWGKQLIPVACSSTRYKEKDSSSVDKSEGISKSIDSSNHLDFTTPVQQVSAAPYFVIVSSHLIVSDTPVLHQGILAFSFRGPPSV